MQNFVPPCNVFSILRDISSEEAAPIGITFEEGRDYCLIHRTNIVGEPADITFVELELEDHSIDTVDSELSSMEDSHEIRSTDQVVMFTFVRQEGPGTLIGLSIPDRKELRIDVVLKPSSK